MLRLKKHINVKHVHVLNLYITTRSGILIEYSKHVMKVGNFVFELLLKALGLNPNHLKDMDCAEGVRVICHDYPACPQPELTSWASKHTDDSFITVLLQDHIGGLQVLYYNHWIDIPMRMVLLLTLVIFSRQVLTFT